MSSTTNPLPERLTAHDADPEGRLALLSGQNEHYNIHTAQDAPLARAIAHRYNAYPEAVAEAQFQRERAENNILAHDARTSALVTALRQLVAGCACRNRFIGVACECAIRIATAALRAAQEPA